MPESVVAVLLAAGSSSRMEGVDKLWTELDGEPLIARSLRTLASVEAITALVVVAPLQRHTALQGLAAALKRDVVCVKGGARRQDSVAAGLAAAPDAEYYLVHDAARPLATAELCARVLAAAREHGAAIPALALADTIKRVDEAGIVVETLDRGALRAAQTPQAFAGALLRRAHAEVRIEATDDAAMVEALGVRVATVPGDARNLKVTTPSDIDLVRALLSQRIEDGR
jgi:2-C-methyl-D-erythritol 4-phosphate cytidylyltransferase